MRRESVGKVTKFESANRGTVYLWYGVALGYCLILEPTTVNGVKRK